MPLVPELMEQDSEWTGGNYLTVSRGISKVKVTFLMIQSLVGVKRNFNRIA